MTYKPPFDPWTNYADHPKANRADLPRIRREWDGDEVCIRLMKRRGNYRQRTQMGYVWGRLTQPTDDTLVAVVERSGETTQIHYTRIQQVWNLSKTIS